MVKRLSALPDWLPIALLGAGLRLVSIGAERLWYDEAYTAWITRLPTIASVIQAARADIHPPGFYLLEWITARWIGSSEIALRLPSAVGSIVAIILLWYIARELGLNRRICFTVALLGALFPAQLYYAQEARTYALLCTCVLLMILGVLQERWILFIVGALGALYGQNLGALYVGSIALWALHRARSRGIDLFGAPLLSLGIVFVGYLPWIPSLLVQINNVNGGFWITPLTAGSVLGSFGEMIAGWRSGDIPQLVMYCGVFALSIVALWVARSWIKSWGGGLILVTMLLPPLTAAAISVVWRLIYLPRAFLPSALLMAFFWGYALHNLGSLERRSFAAVLSPILLVGIIAHYHPGASGGGRWDVKAFLTPMISEWQTGDLLYADNIPPVVLAHYYYPDLPYEIEPIGTGDLNTRLNADDVGAMGFAQERWADLSAGRVWVFLGLGPTSKASELAFAEQLKTTPGAELKAIREQSMISTQLWLIQK